MAFAGYAAAAAAFLGYLGARRAGLARFGLAVAVAASVSHVISYGVACKATEAMVIASRQGSLSLLSLLMVLVFISVSVRYRLPILGAFVMPLVAVAAGAAAVSSAEITHPAVLRGVIFPLHIVSTFAALAGFVSACGIAVAYLVQEKQIKSRNPAPIAYVLPALEALDRLSAGLVALATLFLTVGIVTGVVFEHQESAGYWPGDAKSVVAVGYWVFYVLALLLRRFGGWRGRRQAWMVMAGFILVIATFGVLSHLPPTE